ncbi:MAG: ComEC/Rec2 family competence protein [Elusimicrobiota bacterium]
MKKDPFLITIIKWGCWAYVAGVGVANIIGPQEHEFMVKMWILSGTFFFLSVYLNFASKELVKYTLIPAVMVFGLATYQWKFDTSNPDHVLNTVKPGIWQKKTVRGVIVEDPDVRDEITHLKIKPYEISRGPDKKEGFRKLQGRTGYMIAFVSKRIRENNSYYDDMEYGDMVEISGPLTEPMRLTNPFGFDYAKYLLNKGIYASMYIGDARKISFAGKSELGAFGKIKKYAFRLKDKLILGIKKTIPPPHSAFIGGVTVGARGGVPEIMKYDFQSTGVAHVLALSGLHVGFLAFMLIMVFSNLFKSRTFFYRFPSKLFGREVDLTPYSGKLIPLFVGGVLFMFVVITGARPATVRAAMMYTIGIVFYFWLGMNVRRSGSITIPISAAIMLSFNSFLVYDASFALSFAAVWSIIYLTDPLRRVFTSAIAGWGQVVFLIFLIPGMALLVVSPARYTDMGFVRASVLVFVLAVISAYWLEKKYPLRGFEFEGWWPYISGFFCVQLSIQIGMMWPLSGVYFGRFPIAGIIANFIAIPLIGIIVPLGILGEIFTLVPGIGQQIGLAIGATNTLFSGFFLWMARFFRTYFPYPVQSIPSTGTLVIYYLVVMIFAFNREIRDILTNRLRLPRRPAKWVVAGLMLFLPVSGAITKSMRVNPAIKDKELLVTLLDVGYGNCVLIQTPGGYNILLDGGIRGDECYWTMGKWGKGASVIIPNMAGYNILKLDKIVLTNPLPENAGGLIYIVEHFRINEIWDTLDPDLFRKSISYDKFIDRVHDIRMDFFRDRPVSIGTYLNYYDFIDTCFSRGRRQWLYEGIVLHKEQLGDRALELSVINPPRERIRGTESDLMNNSAVIRLTYGDRSFLFPSNILSESEGDLVARYGDKLKSDVLLIPDHGSTMASSDIFIEKVRPSFAVLQYGYLKDRSPQESEVSRTLKKYKKRGTKIYRTDETGAVEIRCNGRRIKIDTVLGEKK